MPHDHHHHDHDHTCTHDHTHKTAKAQKSGGSDKMFWAILATETSHIFCCVLPTLFSIASLFTGFGIIVTLPGWMENLHGVMHHFEPAAIGFSALVVVLGWGLYYFSIKNDCHDHGCDHKPCGPRKRTASKILIAASILLAFNLAIYFGVHRGQGLHQDHAGHGEYTQEHHEH